MKAVKGAKQNRHQRILEAAISDFIETGIPVSSAELYKKYGFQVKPATIRNELLALTEEGFLVQPHTSAGRVPTDKGYQFFVEQLLQKEMGALQLHALNLRNCADFVDEMAEQLRLLSVGYEAEEKEMYTTGLDELFRHLDFINTEEVYEVANDFEHLDERIDKIFEFVTRDSPKVFIGKSPITRSPHLSVVAELFGADDDQILLMAIGPKRMDYEKVIRTFREIKKQK